jgi:hypothetical protein
MFELIDLEFKVLVFLGQLLVQLPHSLAKSDHLLDIFLQILFLSRLAIYFFLSL